MKISCTVAEIAMMARNCNTGNCSYCVMHDICDSTHMIEDFIAAEDVVPGEKAGNDEPV